VSLTAPQSCQLPKELAAKRPLRGWLCGKRCLAILFLKNFTRHDGGPANA